MMKNINIGNYRQALKDYKEEKSFWRKVKDFIHSVFPF